MREALILYTRDQCGLCAAAQAIAQAAGIVLRPVDISTDIGLLMRYRNAIPVIRDPATGAEISWPFDGDALNEFVARCRSLAGT